MQQQTVYTKTCDGIYLQYNHNEPVTMRLTRNENCIFSISFVNRHNLIIYSEILTKRKNPLFDDKIFSIMGHPVFEVEKDSILRYNDMRKYFENYFNTKYDYLNYEGNNYEGETKDNIPNGIGILYYGQTLSIMAKSNFINGMLDGATVLYSRDQNIELVCDEISDMKPIQMGTIIFKNKNIEKDFDFGDLYSLSTHFLDIGDIDSFVQTVARFVLYNDKSIQNVELFLLSNKTQQEQFNELFKFLVNLQEEFNSQYYQIEVLKRNLNYITIFLIFGFLCLIAGFTCIML